MNALSGKEFMNPDGEGSARQLRQGFAFIWRLLYGVIPRCFDGSNPLPLQIKVLHNLLSRS